MIAALEGQLHVRCIVRNIGFVVHGQELDERHFRHLLAMFQVVLHKDGQTQQFLHLVVDREMEQKETNGYGASHD